jgi:quinol monooxygenase YgiN
VIIVLGAARIRDGEIDRALAVSREHVERSRAEPGCIEHGVHRDAEDPHRLVFVEKWSDAEALRRHFQVPASRAFVKALASLAAAPPSMAIYEASEASNSFLAPG